MRRWQLFVLWVVLVTTLVLLLIYPEQAASAFWAVCRGLQAVND